MNNLLTEKDSPLTEDEWFDCPNGCDVRTVNWIEGISYCPECGEPGAVYSNRNDI